MPPAPGAPLMTEPLALRPAVEELGTPASDEMEGVGVVVRGSAVLEILLILVGVLEVEIVLPDDSAALMLTVML